ncbi:MAG: exo-alpha-sialidase [Verrucomicrobia bacterium]|nr:exo-alpha-sialidase [Verrucomicrobiota bacterium]
MTLRSVLALLLFPLAGAAAEPAITFEELPNPAAASGASGSSLAVDPAGNAWLTWLETEGRATALRFSRFDPAQRRWTPAATVARGEGWFVNWADFPALTADGHGRATAVWFVNNPETPPPPGTTSHAGDHHGPGYRAFISATADHGKTWDHPVPLTRESQSVEFVSLATLADGRVLAAWLDGRARHRGGKFQQLFARVLGTSGPDTLVDPAVCDCCQTTLTAFPDGTALLAYRGRTEDEVRDIRVTRFRGDTWDPPRPLSQDDWRLNACPVNGPQLASDGGRVAAAWYTAADNDPRVLVSFSPDAGGRFLLPLAVNDTKPAGRVATAILRDGALLVTWVDLAGTLWLRRITPDFTSTPPLPLTSASAARVKGFPRLALVRDYLGGNEPARLLVTYTSDAPPAVRTLLVTIPEGELLTAEKNCDCAPTPEQLRGYPIRGTVLRARPEAGRLEIRHGEVPGVIAAGDREMRVAPELQAGASQPGREFLGRIERRDGAWWLFDVRFIVSRPR